MLQDRQPLTDADIQAMPYARLMGKFELMMASMAEERRDAWQIAAFIGWQETKYHLKKGKKGPTLESYFKQMGVSDPSPQDILKPEDKAAMLATVEANDNELRAAMAQAAQERQRAINA